jgi:arginase
MSSTALPGTGKKVSIIGVPLGFGAGKQGSELGAQAMRMSLIRDKTLLDHIADLGYETADAGDVKIPKVKAAAPGENPKHLHEMVEACRNMAASIKNILAGGAIPVILGGDHSIAIGTESGIASHFRTRGEDIGLIWFDAHADINTPATSGSGNIHGMPLAALLGYGNEELVGIEGFSPKIKKEHIAHVGARDLDAGERSVIHELGLRDQFFTMSDIDKRGMMSCVEDAIAIASRASGGYAVTFDVDMIDPRFAPGSGTLVRGGATYREAHLALEIIAGHGGMRSFEIVEVNPLLDQSNITVELACELILSALGKTIL